MVTVVMVGAYMLIARWIFFSGAEEGRGGVASFGGRGGASAGLLFSMILVSGALITSTTCAEAFRRIARQLKQHHHGDAAVLVGFARFSVST